MKRFWWLPVATLMLVAGCNDDEAVVMPRDMTPPAAPRGLTSVTGDQAAYLSWLGNTESDVAGYRIYESTCSSGPSCPYDLVGTTAGTSFVVGGLNNGVTRFFAVAAYDHAGNESPLSYEDVFDTPRPEGFGRGLTNDVDGPSTAGYDFSAFAVRPWDDLQTDIYFHSAGGVLTMVAPFVDTDLQDAGYASTLDAVDFAPSSGWSPSGIVELIPGHCYVARVATGSSYNYAKFRVTSVNAALVVFDWAYQIDPDNRELLVTPTRGEEGRQRRHAS